MNTHTYKHTHTPVKGRATEAANELNPPSFTHIHKHAYKHTHTYTNTHTPVKGPAAEAANELNPPSFAATIAPCIDTLVCGVGCGVWVANVGVVERK